jgi:hypothetical protein
MYGPYGTATRGGLYGAATRAVRPSAGVDGKTAQGALSRQLEVTASQHGCASKTAHAPPDKEDSPMPPNSEGGRGAHPLEQVLVSPRSVRAWRILARVEVVGLPLAHNVVTLELARGLSPAWPHYRRTAAPREWCRDNVSTGVQQTS